MKCNRGNFMPKKDTCVILCFEKMSEERTKILSGLNNMADRLKYMAEKVRNDERNNSDDNLF